MKLEASLYAVDSMYTSKTQWLCLYTSAVPLHKTTTEVRRQTGSVYGTLRYRVLKDRVLGPDGSEKWGPYNKIGVQKYLNPNLKMWWSMQLCNLYAYSEMKVQ